MAKHVGLCPSIRMVNTSFISQKLNWKMVANKQIPDKYLKKENGEIIGYEKLGGVYQEKEMARSMVEGRCLWGKGIINWKCSFR